MLWLLTDSGRELLYGNKLRQMILDLESTTPMTLVNPGYNVENNTTNITKVDLFLRKIGLNIETITAEDCANILMETLTNENIDELSRLLLLERPYLITLAYLVKSNYISDSEISKFLKMNTSKTRNEYILSLIPQSETSDIDIFGGLKTMISKLYTGISYGEVKNEKDIENLVNVLKSELMVIPSRKIICTPDEIQSIRALRKYPWYFDTNIYEAAQSILLNLLKDITELTLLLPFSTALLLTPEPTTIAAAFGYLYAKINFAKNADSVFAALYNYIGDDIRFLGFDLNPVYKTYYFNLTADLVYRLYKNRKKLKNNKITEKSYTERIEELDRNLLNVYLDDLQARLTGKFSGLLRDMEDIRPVPDPAFKHRDFSTVYTEDISTIFNKILDNIGVRKIYKQVGYKSQTEFIDTSKDEMEKLNVSDYEDGVTFKDVIKTFKIALNNITNILKDIVNEIVAEVFDITRERYAFKLKTLNNTDLYFYVRTKTVVKKRLPYKLPDNMPVYHEHGYCFSTDGSFVNEVNIENDKDSLIYTKIVNSNDIIEYNDNNTIRKFIYNPSNHTLTELYEADEDKLSLGFNKYLDFNILFRQNTSEPLKITNYEFSEIKDLLKMTFIADDDETTKNNKKYHDIISFGSMKFMGIVENLRSSFTYPNLTENDLNIETIEEYVETLKTKMQTAINESTTSIKATGWVSGIILNNYFDFIIDDTEKTTSFVPRLDEEQFMIYKYLFAMRHFFINLSNAIKNDTYARNYLEELYNTYGIESAMKGVKLAWVV